MRCAHCSVAEGLPCLGERAPPLCRDVKRGMPGRAEQLLAIAEGRARPAAPDVQASRQAICRTCEHFDAEAYRCQICMCGLKLRISSAASACPDNPPRWPAVSIA